MGTRELPAGDVCFLFTDVEASTAILRAVGDAAWAEMQATMHATIRSAVESCGGYLVNTDGDGCFAAFSSCANAARATADAQDRLCETSSQLAVRMGLHLGRDIYPRDDDYVALAVHRAARVMSAANGRQVLATADVVARCTAEQAAEQFVDLGPFSIRDFDGPVQLYELDHDGAPRQPRVPVAFDQRVPGYDTALVGRDVEVSDILARLETAALMTLTGPPGIGKTRLALAVLAQQSTTAIAGPWFVDLTAAAHASDVGDVIARSVGCPPDNELDVYLDTVLDERQGLLCLDGCDHLIDAAAAAADLLMTWCPSLRVIATAEQPLGLPNESQYAVAPLALPSSPEPSAVLESAAGRLFLERARDSTTSVEISDTAARSAFEICHAVAGVPLGIELAAGMAASSSPSSAATTDMVALVDAALDALPDDLARALGALTVALLPTAPQLAGAALAGAAVENGEEVLVALTMRSLIQRDTEAAIRIHHLVIERADGRLDRTVRHDVQLSLLEKCLRATADKPVPLAKHEPFAPTAMMLLDEADLPARERQQLARQLGPWCLGRLNGRRARSLLEAALHLGDFGPSTAALHLAVADTYTASDDTADAEQHIRDAARAIGDHDAVDPQLIERLKRLTTSVRMDDEVTPPQ